MSNAPTMVSSSETLEIPSECFIKKRTFNYNDPFLSLANIDNASIRPTPPKETAAKPPKDSL